MKKLVEFFGFVDSVLWCQKNSYFTWLVTAIRFVALYEIHTYQPQTLHIQKATLCKSVDLNVAFTWWGFMFFFMITTKMTACCRNHGQQEKTFMMIVKLGNIKICVYSVQEQINCKKKWPRMSWVESLPNRLG